MAAWRIVQPRLPAVEWIVVAVADEGAYAGIVKLLQTGDEPVLSAEAAVRAVVDVSGDQQCVHSLGNAKVDDVRVGVKRRFIQQARHIVRGSGLQPGKRAVEVQIGGVNESESHRMYRICYVRRVRVGSLSAEVSVSHAQIAG